MKEDIYNTIKKWIQNSERPKYRYGFVHMTISFLLLPSRLHVQCENGVIYATRYTITGVFFWSNEQSDESRETVKLKRETKTPVFNLKTFSSRLEAIKENPDAISKVKRPKIIFTLGFPWIPGSGSLLNTYVHVDVAPIAAVEKLDNMSSRLNIKSESIDPGSLKKKDIYKSDP